MTRHAANSIANWLIINRVSDLPQRQLSWSRQRRNAQPNNRLPWSYHLSRMDDKNTQFKTHHIERLVMVPCATGATTKLKARQSLRDLRQSSSRLRFDALHHRSVFPLVKTFGFAAPSDTKSRPLRGGITKTPASQATQKTPHYSSVKNSIEANCLKQVSVSLFIAEIYHIGFSCSSRSERFRVAANGGVSCL